MPNAFKIREENMNEFYSIIQPILNKYNVNNDDPSFTPTQKFVLDKLNEVQKVLKTNIKQIETENKKISETQSNIKDIEFRIANLEGQNQALLEMLANLQEEGSKQ